MNEYDSIEFLLKEMLKRGADSCEVVIANKRFTATIVVEIKDIEFKSKADAEA